MKFLCVPCDTPMQLVKTDEHEEIKSLSVVYSCPSCLYEMAMLTNPYETQLVTSLGVKIGPEGEKKEGESKCPFANMFGKESAGESGSDSVEKPPQVSSTSGDGGYQWSAEALARLERIPEFVRPMAKMGIEEFAKSEGLEVIDEAALSKALERFGM